MPIKHSPGCGCCGCDIFTVNGILAIGSTTSEVIVSGSDRTIIKSLPQVNWKLSLTIGSDTSNTSGSVTYSLIRSDDSVFATFDLIYGVNRFGTTGAGRRKVDGRVDIDPSDIARYEFNAFLSSASSYTLWLAMRPEGLLTNFLYYAYDGSGPSAPSTLRYQSSFTNVFVPFELADIPSGLRLKITTSSPSPSTPTVNAVAEKTYVEAVYESCGEGGPVEDPEIITPAKNEACTHPVACSAFATTYSTPRWKLGDEPAFSFDSLSPRSQKQYSACQSFDQHLSEVPESSLTNRTEGYFYDCSNPANRTGLALTALYSTFDAEPHIEKRLRVTLSATSNPQTCYVTASIEILGTFWKTGTPATTTVYGPLGATSEQPAIEQALGVTDPCGGATRAAGSVRDTYFPGSSLPGVADVIEGAMLRNTVSRTSYRIITWRREICRFDVPPELTFTDDDLYVTGDSSEITTTQYLITGISFTGGVGDTHTRMKATMDVDYITLDPSTLTCNIVPDDETWMLQPFA